MPIAQSKGYLGHSMASPYNNYLGFSTHSININNDTLRSSLNSPLSKDPLTPDPSSLPHTLRSITPTPIKLTALSGT